MKKILSLFLIFFVSSLCLELLVRITGIAPELNYEYSEHIADPYLPYKPKPFGVREGRNQTDEFDYSYHFNSLGFRDVEHSIAKPEGVFRILGLGDSFTLGTGVNFEHTYLFLLEQLLNSRPGVHPKIEIIKMGLGRFFTEPERLTFEHYGVQFQPDLVLVGFLPNDIMDTHLGFDAIKVDEQGRLRTKESLELGSWASFLFENSHVCRILLSKYISYKISQTAPMSFDSIYEANGPLEKDWLTAESELLKINTISNKIFAKTAIIHIPQSNPSVASHAYPSQRLLSWCTHNNISFIDTLPALKNYSGSEELYYPKDGHCTQFGYEIIAKVIFEYLDSNHLVP